MGRKQTKNYKIKYNYTYAKEDMVKIMEENFIKYYKNIKNKHTLNK
jgi:hypothetical protein